MKKKVKRGIYILRALGYSEKEKEEKIDFYIMQQLYDPFKNIFRFDFSRNLLIFRSISFKTYSQYL